MGASKVAPAGATNVQVRLVVGSLNAMLYADSFAVRVAASPACNQADVPDPGQGVPPN